MTVINFHVVQMARNTPSFQLFNTSLATEFGHHLCTQKHTNTHTPLMKRMQNTFSLEGGGCCCCCWGGGGGFETPAADS